MPISNPAMADYDFLEVLYEDEYFPNHVLDKAKAILVRLCERLEAEPPADVEALHVLTHAATEAFHDLEEECEAAGSEIGTVAREELCGDLYNIAAAYGFSDVDPEELAGPRNW